MMRTLTIEIPDNLADLLDTMPPDKRNNFAVSAMLNAIEDDAKEILPSLPPSLSGSLEDDLREAFADVDAGRVYPGEVVLAELRQRAGRK